MSTITRLDATAVDEYAPLHDGAAGVGTRLRTAGGKVQADGQPASQRHAPAMGCVHHASSSQSDVRLPARVGSRSANPAKLDP